MVKSACSILFEFMGEKLKKGLETSAVQHASGQTADRNEGNLSIKDPFTSLVANGCQAQFKMLLGNFKALHGLGPSYLKIASAYMNLTGC